MAVEITVPRLGWSMDEGTFGEWLSESGDRIEPGEMIFVLEGDKAAHEVESFDSGILHIPADGPQPGDTVAVGQLIGFLLAEGETPPGSLQSSSGSSGASEPVTSPPSASPAVAAENQPVVGSSGRRVRRAATPRARRKARELGIDWNSIPGSGRNGRVRERDIPVSARPSHRASTTEFTPVAPGRHRPASKVRRAIAERMIAATQQTAAVTLTTKVNAQNLVKFRDELKTQAGGDVVPGYTDLIVILVAAALPDCPELNACWYNDGVFVYDDVHIGLAVDTDAGLVAPVITDVGSLSLNEVARRSGSLAQQARTGTLSQDQLQGATFTITSLGMYDVDFFTPIINPPQSAILGIGRIVEEPVMSGGHIVVGQTMGLSLTFDHRVIDGAPAARWLQRLSEMLLQPRQWIGQDGRFRR